MKKYLLLIALLFSASILACQPLDTDDEEEEQQETSEKAPEPGEFSFVFPDFKVNGETCTLPKSGWEEGDEILIHGNYVPGVVTIKLKGNEISADGLVATVNIDPLPKGPCAPNFFYAAYPASAVKLSGNFCTASTDFSQADILLLAAYQKDRSFKFTPACTAIAFTVSGDFDACVFSSGSYEEIYHPSMVVEYTSKQSLFEVISGDGKAFRDIDITPDGKTLNVIYIPGTVNLRGGFKLFFIKGDRCTKAYIHGKSAYLRHGELLSLGDITSKLEDRDHEIPGPPVLPVMGERKQYIVDDVRELSGLCLTKDKDALWTVGDEGQLAKLSFECEVLENYFYKTDLEGVTVDPETGTIYASVESHYVLILDPYNDPYKDPKHPESSPLQYTSAFNIPDAAGYGNSGCEGITWYKDNTLYIGAQTGAWLWNYDLKGKQISKSQLNTKIAGMREIAGLSYDAATDLLWVVDSEAHKIFVLTGEADLLLGSYPIPYLGNPESICVDPDHNCVWVGDDDDNHPSVTRISFTGLDKRPVIY